MCYLTNLCTRYSFLHALVVSILQLLLPNSARHRRRINEDDVDDVNDESVAATTSSLADGDAAESSESAFDIAVDGEALDKNSAPVADSSSPALSTVSVAAATAASTTSISSSSPSLPSSSPLPSASPMLDRQAFLLVDVPAASEASESKSDAPMTNEEDDDDDLGSPFLRIEATEESKVEDGDSFPAMMDDDNNE